jgi:hypothetical protein
MTIPAKAGIHQAAANQRASVKHWAAAFAGVALCRSGQIRLFDENRLATTREIV